MVEFLSDSKNSTQSSDFPGIIRRKFPLFHKHLSQIKRKFENIFRRSSGAYEAMIHEKNQYPKI
jgi:hypothetical protein